MNKYNKINYHIKISPYDIKNNPDIYQYAKHTISKEIVDKLIEQNLITFKIVDDYSGSTVFGELTIYKEPPIDLQPDVCKLSNIF